MDEIQLDWEVESNTGKTTVEEDAAIVTARRRRVRRSRRTLLTAITILAVSIGMAVWRLHQVDQLVQARLEDVIAAETLALRIGDRDAFLRTQTRDAAWQAVQRQTFADFQALSPRVELPGEILAMDATDEEASVTLLVIVDGERESVDWLYRMTDAGWRHANSLAQPWGPQALRGDGVEVGYYTPDHEVAREVQRLLSGWWLVGRSVIHDRSFTLRALIDPRWEGSPYIAENGVVIVPHTSLSERERDALAELISDQWASQLIGTSAGDFEGWVGDEIAGTLARSFHPAAPYPLILGYASATHSIGLLPDFIGYVNDGDLGADALQRAMAANQPLNLGTGALLQQHLQSMLRSEAALRAWEATHTRSVGDWQWQTSLAFLDQERRFQTNPYSGIPVQPYLFSRADPNTIMVTELQSFQEIMWAAVEAQELPGESAAGRRLRVWVPFRQQEGVWIHTDLGSDDLGEILELHEGRTILYYYALDAKAALTLQRILSEVVPQIEHDFGVDQLPAQVVVRLHPFFIPFFSGTNPLAIDFTVESPYVACCVDEETPASYMRQITAINFGREVMAYRLGQSVPDRQNHPLLEAILRYEVEAITGQAPPILTGHGTPIPAQTLEDLWSPSIWSHVNDSPAQTALDARAADALIDIVIERAGPEAISVLIDHFNESETMEEWLSASLDLHAEDIEAAWRARFDELAGLP